MERADQIYVDGSSVVRVWSYRVDSAPRLPTKHLLARFHLQPVHIVVMWTRRLNVYYSLAQNGQHNASVTLVIRLTSQM